jgi:hypothetical protein
MKTGRLLKFQRPGGQIQAYLYLEGGVFHAALFRIGTERSGQEPLQRLTGASEAKLEEAVRHWVDRHYPRERKAPE